MKWSTLKIIFGGIVGNSIFVISLFSILAVVPIISKFIVNLNTSIALLGAIFISLSYITQKIFSPAIIKQYKDSHEYYLHTKKLQESIALDVIHEFAILEGKSDVKNLPIYKDNSINMLNFKDIDSTIKLLGEERSIYYLALLKFDYLDNKNSCLRYLLTMSFLLGVAFLYWPACNRIYVLIMGGLINGG